MENEPLIPRASPEFIWTLSGEEVPVNHYNTKVFRFRKYPEMDHIYYWWGDEDDSYTYIFNCEDQIKALEESDFDITIANEPCNKDIEAYVLWQSTRLDSELENL